MYLTNTVPLKTNFDRTHPGQLSVTRTCFMISLYRNMPFCRRQDNAMVKSVAILGAGIVGLSTAVRLQSERPQLQITLVADSFGQDTTSHGAAGILRPSLDRLPDVPTEQLRWGNFLISSISFNLLKHRISATGWLLFLRCVSFTFIRLLPTWTQTEIFDAFLAEHFSDCDPIICPRKSKLRFFKVCIILKRTWHSQTYWILCVLNCGGFAAMFSMTVAPRAPVVNFSSTTQIKVGSRQQNS